MVRAGDALAWRDARDATEPPRDAPRHAGDTSRQGAGDAIDASGVPPAALLEAARLAGELDEVRARLADAQAERDCWH
jgi:hypothetical protein